MDQLNFLSFHVLYLTAKSGSLSLIVLHILLHVVRRARSLTVQLGLFILDLLFVHLQLSLLLTHLMSQFLQHCNLLTSLVIHDCCLLRDTRVV